MKLGPIHVVRDATMAVMQGMMHRLAAQRAEAQAQLERLQLSLNPKVLHPGADARLAPSFAADPDPDDEAGRQAAGRVLAAYRKARVEFRPAAPGLWDLLEARNAGPFVAALEAGDEPAVLGHLRAMLRTDLTWGLGCVGAEVWHLARGPAAGSLYHLRFTDILVSLAEAVGARRVPNFEQQPDAYRHALDVDLDAVFEAVECRTGLDLSFPNVGGAFGFVLCGRRTTSDSLMHACTAARLRQLGAGPADNVAEIGGGYGCLALLLFRAGITHYTVYDLPWVNALQGYFLIRSLPPGSVRLFGEDAGPLAVLPGWCFERVADRSLDHVINTNSLPEMGAATARDYLRTLRRGLRGVFLSINQEAGALVPGYGPQQCVAELADELGGLRRLARSRHWVRDGYVEEVYGPAPPAPLPDRPVR